VSAVLLGKRCLRGFLALALLAIAGGAQAANCHLNIEANDLMQFNARALQIDPECGEVQLTLKHVGKQPAHVLGHDWVLARSADVSALASAGLAAGYDKGYLPADDPRIIAATHVIGGGESATITFSTERLQPGVDYAYFCSYPGHTAMMRGRLLLVGRPRLATNLGATAAATP